MNKDKNGTIEKRFIPLDECELRAQVSDDGKKKTIIGYAAVFNKWGSDAWGFKERIAPGAFKNTLAEAGRNIRACFNHDPNFILGTTRNGTVRLEEDQRGLYLEIDVNENDPQAVSVFEKIKRGDVTGQSFSFRMKEEDWKYPEDGMPERTLIEVDLSEAGPVTFPFYEETDVDVALRSMEDNRPPAAPDPDSEGAKAEARALMDQLEKELILDEEELGDILS